MAENIRAELDNSDESVGKKVRGVKMQKIPYWIVIGDKEIENKNVSVESRDKGNIGSLKLEDFVSQIKEEINNRK